MRGPAFSVPMYPVVTMGEGAHQGSRDKLLGLDPSPELIDAYSCEKHVPADAPPTFMALAADDTTVPPHAQCRRLFLRRCRPPRCRPRCICSRRAAMASASRARWASPTAAWPDLLLHWGASHGFFKGA